jgi:GNAT superfamily N-acetyltransferase
MDSDTNTPYVGSLALRPLTEGDANALQALCCACADYFQEITGAPAGPAEAQAIFAAIPPHGDYQKKRLWGAFEEERLIGVIDGAFDHPESGHFWIGLFMLEPIARRKGRGAHIVETVERYARRGGSHVLSLAVKKGYVAAQAFWRSLRFSSEGSRTVAVGRTMIEFDLMNRSIRD